MVVLVSGSSGTTRTPVRNKQTPKLTCLLRPEQLGRARTLPEPDDTCTTNRSLFGIPIRTSLRRLDYGNVSRGTTQTYCIYLKIIECWPYHRASMVAACIVIMWLKCFPLDNFGTVVGENPDCLLLSGTVVGENPDHVCWVCLREKTR